MSISSKVVLITGASRGIGAEIARSFAKHKASLSLSAIDDENFDEVVDDCKELGAVKVLKIVTDLSKKDNMEMVMNETIKKLGQLDVLINNAGIPCGGSVETIKLEDFDKTFEINTRTPLYLTQLATPHLEKTKGNIVNISSIAAKIAVVPMVGYSISKCALDQLTKISALELAPKGIKVNGVNLGPVDTPVMKPLAAIYGAEEEAIKSFLATKNPLAKKLIDVKEVADSVLFLTSEKASMITGTNLVIDGGCLLAGQ